MNYERILGEIDDEIVAEGGVPLNETPDFVLGYMSELATTPERKDAIDWLREQRTIAAESEE